MKRVHIFGVQEYIQVLYTYCGTLYGKANSIDFNNFTTG